MITIVDAVMGTGKSTWAIDEINKHPEKKYIILTPPKTEVTRYKEGISSAHNGSRSDVIALDDDGIGTKTSQLKDAIQDGKTVVTTHNLFTRLDREGFRMISDQGDYELIIDETIELVGEKLINQDDLQMLVETRKIWITPTRIEGMFTIETDINGDDYKGSFKNFINAANGQHVYKVNKAAVVFVVPPEKLTIFKNVHIMTYLADGSETHCWLQLHKLDFDHKELKRDKKGHKLIPHSLMYSGSDFKHLITIFDDKKLNSIGVKKRSTTGHPLSHTWFKTTGARRKNDLKQLGNHTENFFKNKMKVKSVDILWTCPKGKEEHDGKGKIRKMVKKSYFDPAKTKTWLAYTTRATNDYKNRHFLAFLLNVFPRPAISRFFREHGITMNQERIALSTLVQWIWRSAIREKEAITIYLPSERMRKILKGWL